MALNLLLYFILDKCVIQFFSTPYINSTKWNKELMTQILRSSIAVAQYISTESEMSVNKIVHLKKGL